MRSSNVIAPLLLSKHRLSQADRPAAAAAALCMCLCAASCCCPQLGPHRHTQSVCMQVFACVVGQRPSKAKFYVNDVNDVVELLAKIAGVGLPPRNASF